MSVIEFDRARPERRLGEYETIWEDPDFFLTLPQVRDVKNPIFDELKDSIRDGDLLNPIDVVHIDATLLAEYIDFVNRTWKRSIALEDYDKKMLPDNTYYLVVAGHTRHEAVSELDKEPGAPQYKIPAKVHVLRDVSEIIDIQVRENLHSVPRQEQAAIAIVEQYQWGIERENWTSKSEYIKKKQGRISPRQLSEALHFADLPDEVKLYVFSRELHYGVAIEIGKGYETVIEHTAAKMGLDMDAEIDDETKATLQLTVNRKLIAMINHMNGKTQTSKKKLNVTAAKKYLKARFDGMNSDIAEIRGDTRDEPDALFELASPEEQAGIYVEQINAEFSEMMRYIQQNTIEAIDQTLHLAKKLESAGVNHLDMTTDLEDRRAQHELHFGANVLTTVNSR